MVEEGLVNVLAKRDQVAELLDDGHDAAGVGQGRRQQGEQVAKHQRVQLGRPK